MAPPALVPAVDDRQPLLRPARPDARGAWAMAAWVPRRLSVTPATMRGPKLMPPSVEA